MEIKVEINKDINQFSIKVDNEVYTFRGVVIEDRNCILCDKFNCPMLSPKEDGKKNLDCGDMRNPLPFKYNDFKIENSLADEFTDFCSVIADPDQIDETSLKDVSELFELKEYLRANPKLEFLPIKNYYRNN